MLLKSLVNCLRNGLVDAGSRGELVARILLLLAWDKCFSGMDKLASSNFLQAVKLRDFLQPLLNLNAEMQATLKTAFDSPDKTAWVRCTHFVKIDYVPTACQLLALFKRGAAAITKDLQTGFDLVLPVICCNNSETILLDSMVSGVFIQVKNGKSCNSDYPGTATTQLTPMATGIKISNRLPFLSLYMNIGAFVEPGIKKSGCV
jgi:hypothetical protein